MKSMFDLLAGNAACGLPALNYGNKTESYATLVRKVKMTAAYFTSIGVKSGDTVTVAMPNIPASVYVMYALNALGAVQNNIHPLSPVEQIIGTARDTKSAFVVTIATAYKGKEELIESSGVPFVFANPVYDDGVLMRLLFRLKYGKIKRSEKLYLLDDFRKMEPQEQFVPHDCSAPSFYLHSGGTTSQPKIIALSDDAINNLALKVDGIIPSGIEGKAMLAVLPTFHGFGLAMGIHTPLVCRAQVSLMMKFNAKKVLNWIDCGKVSFIIGIPLLFRKLMRCDGFRNTNLKNLEYAFVGGDLVPISLIEEFNAAMLESGSACRLYEGYGLTETVTVCTVNTRENYKVGSVGKPLRGIDVEIRGEDGAVMSPGEVGEVYVYGDTLMNCYYEDEAATQATLERIGEGIAVKSGDLGYIDSEGFIFLKGRKKRIFKISGVNVYPAEIEKIASDREEVAESALEFFAEPKPHTVLYLIKRKTAAKNDETIKEEIMRELSQRVLKYCLPTKVIFMDEFPKTKIGKIDHSAFRDVD